jgi:hypothetical protein
VRSGGGRRPSHQRSPSLINLPPLQIGRAYRHEEIRPYLARPGDGEQDDFVRVVGNWSPETNGEWERWRPELLHPRHCVAEYQELPPAVLRPQAGHLFALFAHHRDHGDRLQAILDTLKAGGMALPVLVLANDPGRTVQEGKHRLVAFRHCAFDRVPAFLVGPAPRPLE